MSAVFFGGKTRSLALCQQAEGCAQGGGKGDGECSTLTATLYCKSEKMRVTKLGWLPPATDDHLLPVA